MQWHVRRWLNAPEEGYAISDFRGRVLVVHTFQMLCPGCVLRSLPQAKRVRATFSEADVAVVGLHTVFEHHDAMRDVSLEAFLHEFAITFPVGVDAHVEGHAVPRTMAEWGLRGTPSTVIFDAEGRLAHRSFGTEEDLVVGARIATLASTLERPGSSGGCTPDGCSI